MKRNGPAKSEAPWRPKNERPGSRPASKGNRDRPLVLVVEDDPNDWEIYGKILWYNGFDVIYAADGGEGLSLAKKHHPNLMLIDLMLPGMDGLALCRETKADPDLRDTPVVMLTARSQDSFGGKAREAGCDTFLEKPQSPVDVVHCIEGIIGKPPLSGEGRPPALSESS